MLASVLSLYGQEVFMEIVLFHCCFDLRTQLRLHSCWGQSGDQSSSSRPLVEQLNQNEIISKDIKICVLRRREQEREGGVVVY